MMSSHDVSSWFSYIIFVCFQVIHEVSSHVHPLDLKNFTMARWSRALGAARRAVHLAVVPAPASPCYALNSLAAAGIVLGSSLVACKEKKKNKVPEIKEISTGQLGKLMMLIHDGTFCQGGKDS